MILRALQQLIKPFTGIPAPDYLEDDEWFGPATLSEKQLSLKEARAQAEADLQILSHEDEHHGPVEVDNIHESCTISLLAEVEPLHNLTLCLS